MIVLGVMSLIVSWNKLDEDDGSRAIHVHALVLLASAVLIWLGIYVINP